MCRIRRLPTFFVAAFAAMALTGVGVTLAVQNGVVANSIFLACLFGFCLLMLAAVFGFLGNSRQPFQFAIGWLFIATTVLACALPVVGIKYDLHSLLLSKPPFDFEEAAYQKKLKSYSGVDVTLTRTTWGSGTNFAFVFKSEDTENFFNEFGSLGTGNSGCDIFISDMGSRTNLSGLKGLSPTRLRFSDCELSSQQLADLAELEITVSFTSCTFVKSDVQQAEPIFSSDVGFWSSTESKIHQFVDATDAFKFNAEVQVYNGRFLSDQGVDAILDLVEKTSSDALVSLNSVSKEIEVENLKNRKNLDRLEVVNCDLTLSANGKPRSSASFAFLLETEANVQGQVNQNDSLWELALAAKGELRPLGFVGVENPKTLLNSKSLNESVFTYQKSELGEVEKLWLPQCDKRILRKIGQLESLKAISFDIGWLGNDYISGQFSNEVPAGLQAESLLNEMTNLEELYFADESVDFSLLTSLSKLRTIQFSSGSTGFSHDLFPELKEVRIVLDKPMKNGLMRELKAIEALERLVVIDIHVTNFNEQQFLKQARPFFGEAVELSVVDSEDGGKLASEEFGQHRLEIRKKCVEKYLN